MATTTDKSVDLDERFKFGPAPIQTPEDAAMAFLREEITEDEFRAACGKFGVLPGSLFNNMNPASPSRVDAAFHRQIPDDIFLTTPAPETSLERKLEEVNAKQDLREAAVKEAEKKRTSGNTVMTVPFDATELNLTADEAHDLEEKILVPHLAANPENVVPDDPRGSTQTLNTRGRATRPAEASAKKSVAKK